MASIENPADRRVRAIQITSKGRTQLRKAVTFWRQAESRVRHELGHRPMVSLNDMLEMATVKLGDPP